MSPFQKDKDLRAGDMMAATVIGAEKQTDDGLVNGMRAQFAQAAVQQGKGQLCDLVILAVPAGRGAPFVEGLMESIANDDGGEVLR